MGNERSRQASGEAQPDAHQLPAELVRDVADATSPDVLLRTLTRWIPKIIRAERSTIALPSPDKAGMLDLVSIIDERLEKVLRSLPIEGTYIGESFSSLKQVRIDDMRPLISPELSPLIDGGYVSGLISPLVAGGKCYGTINVANSTLSSVSDSDAELLASVGALVASFLRVHAAAQTAEISAITDDLTSQLNRRGILAHLDQQTTKTPGATSVMYIDVDGFKSINDAFGHSIGDAVIASVSQRLAESLGDRGRVGRLGGDEFLAVLPDDPSGAAALRYAEDIRSGDQSIRIGQLVLAPIVSIGIATQPNAFGIAEQLMRDADAAMYVAKHSTSRIASADDSIRRSSQTKATVDRELDQAMADGSLCYHFQPIRSLGTGEIMGAEALLRWNHRRLGPVPAPIIIERIEATGRINDFTKWSLETVAREWTTVRSHLPWFHDKATSINLSPHQLAWSAYSDVHARVLEQFGLRAEDIIIEVVESAPIQNGDPSAATLRRLADAGVIIALDDFGTGHNALSYFTMFPIHAIKLDRSLVGLVQSNEISRTILASLATMAHDLGIMPVAEGIETAAEARLCLDVGVEHGQGWHLGYPLPAEEFIAFARQQHADRSRANV